MTGRTWLLAVMLAVALLFRAEPGHAVDGVAATWERAAVALPAGLAGTRPVIGNANESAVKAALARIDGAAGASAVVFLHGCEGVGEEEESLKLILMQNGYATFMPNSFARTGRRSNCLSGEQITGFNPAALEWRREEIKFAVAQLLKLPWVARVFAIGFSEGAMAVASYPGDDLAGLVILGWHCQGNPPFDGIKAPSSLPVLAVIGDQDPWYRARPDYHCGNLFDGRSDARSVILPGNGHAIINSPDVTNAETARAAILEFLMVHQGVVEP